MPLKYKLFIIIIVSGLLLPTFAYSQIDIKLLKKTHQIINLVKEGNSSEDPNPLMDAIKILLDNQEIQPIKGRKEVTLDYESKDYFDIAILYRNTKKLIASYDKNTQLKLERLKPAIEKRLSPYKKMELVDGGIEVEVYTVKPKGTIPVNFFFSKGNQVQFLVEVGDNFNLEIKQNNQSLNIPKIKIGNQYVYTFNVKETGEYQTLISNILSKKEDCTLYKHIK